MRVCVCVCLRVCVHVCACVRVDQSLYLHQFVFIISLQEFLFSLLS